MRFTYRAIALASALFVAGWWWLTPSPPTATQPAPGAGTAGAVADGSPRALPFTGTTDAVHSAAQQRIELREQRMAQGGYGTPQEYFYLPLAKLREMGARGDIYALLQLGQQYWDEPDTIASQHGLDNGVPAARQAEAYFTQAVMSGATRPALTLASKLSASDPVESYAWATFAEKLQLQGAPELVAQLRARLTERELEAAMASSDKKYAEFTSNATPSPN